MLKRSHGLYSTPRGIPCHCSSSLCSNLGNLAAGNGYNHEFTPKNIPGVVDQRCIRTRKASQVGMT